MSIELAKDIWDELAQWVNTIDHEVAADSLVSILVDHDYDIHEIKQAFKSDRAVKNAIKTFEKDEHWHNDDDDEHNDEESGDY